MNTFKKSYLYYVACFGIIFLLSGCAFLHQENDDSFYNDFGGYDSLRIPLIMPYYMIYLDKEYSWQMPLLADPPSKSTYYYFNLHNIQKLAVENNVIMVYTPYVESNIDQSIGQKIYHWFVIVPASNVEEGFENEETFLDYIRQFDIQQPNWLDPNETYKKFFQTNCLEWIPNCK